MVGCEDPRRGLGAVAMATFYQGNTYRFQAHMSLDYGTGGVERWRGAGITPAQVDQDIRNALSSVGEVDSSTTNLVSHALLADSIDMAIVFRPTAGDLDSASVEAKLAYGVNYRATNAGLPTAGTALGFGGTYIIDAHTIASVPIGTGAQSPSTGGNLANRYASALGTVHSTNPELDGHSVIHNAAPNLVPSLTDPLNDTVTKLEIIGGIILGIAAIAAIAYLVREVNVFRSA